MEQGELRDMERYSKILWYFTREGTTDPLPPQMILLENNTEQCLPSSIKVLVKAVE